MLIFCAPGQCDPYIKVRNHLIMFFQNVKLLKSKISNPKIQQQARKNKFHKLNNQKK